MSDIENLTPAMQQFYEIKKEYNDSVLFFRMGDFYEMFGVDAEIAHSVLGIAITSRNKNALNPEKLAGFPYHARDKYLPKLLEAGYKVAIAEQVSDPKAKWIVKREVVRVVTPATLDLESEILEGKNFSNNSIISIFEEKWKYWFSIIDLSTNAWKVWEFSDFNSLSKELYKVSPKEVILEKSLFWNTQIENILTKKYSLNIYFFSAKNEAKTYLQNHFKTKNLEWFGIENKLLATKAWAMLLEYIESNQKTSLGFLRDLSFDSFSGVLDLDESTIRNLDLIYNFATRSSKNGTLFGVMDETNTSAWARLLRQNILNPLKDEKQIETRYDIIEEFLANPILLSKVEDKLKWVSDIDAILNRVALERVNPRELLNLKKSLISIIEAFDLIKADWSEKLKKLLNI